MMREREMVGKEAKTSQYGKGKNGGSLGQISKVQFTSSSTKFRAVNQQQYEVQSFKCGCTDQIDGDWRSAVESGGGSKSRQQEENATIEDGGESMLRFRRRVSAKRRSMLKHCRDECPQQER